MNVRERLIGAVPWLVGALAGVLALGPALGRGYVLRYDMVFVPDPALAPAALGAGGGFPRAVPSDAAVAVLSAVLPADVVQSLLLLAVFVLGAAGAARLVPALPSARLAEVLARAAAGTAYVWNPFVAERLLLGQWAMLLGYAGLPWVLAAATGLRGVRDLPRLVTALVPAAVGGFSSIVLSALTAGPAVLLGSRRPRVLAAAGLFALGLVLVSLPWLVPALGSGARTDPAAVDAFAARADTPFGAAGSLLLLGGIWNAQAVPAGYGEPVTATARLLLCLAALAGWAWLWSTRALPFGRGLTAAAVLGLLIALLGTVEPGREALRALIAAWPGFGPLRDGQLYVAPLALVQAVGLGGVVLWLAGRGNRKGGSGTCTQTAQTAQTAAVGAAAFTVLAPFVLLPGLLWGADGRLAPVDYPAEWSRVQELVADDPRPGAVLLLPWSAYRGLDWAGDGRTVVVLDPAVKLFDRRTVWNDDLRVGDESGGRPPQVVTGEDPLARAAARALEVDPADGMPREADPRLPAELGRLGIRYILVETAALHPPPSIENEFLSVFDGVRTVFAGPGLLLLEIEDQDIKADKVRLSGLEVTGWLVTVGAIGWSIAASGSSLVFQRPGRSTGAESRKENHT